MRAVTLVTTAAAAVLALAACTGATPAATGTPAPTDAAQTPAVPADWGLPADPAATVRAAGLPMLGAENVTVHYHAHLDIAVDGRPVTVPAGIGIDEVHQRISPLHTHEPDGVVHIESATDVPFTLGQVFTEWGQPLRARQVGPVTLSAAQVLRVYRDGQPVTGDPAALRLGAHDEIVVWVGPAGAQPTVPASYAFAPGE